MGKEEKKKEVDILAVSIKPSPILKGEPAKRLVLLMDKPTDKTKLFEKCKKLSTIFKRV